jgi:hypothetical protein
MTAGKTTKEKTKADGCDRVKERLAARTAEIEVELVAERATITEATLALQNGEPDPEILKRLAAAERKAAKLESEQRRLERAAVGLDERIAEARRVANLERQRVLAQEYIATRDRVQAARLRVLAAFDAVADDVAFIRNAAGDAHRFGVKLGWRAEIGISGLGALRHYVAALCAHRGGAVRGVAAARKQLEDPWRRPSSPVDLELRELDL